VETIGTINWTEAGCATGDARLLHLFFSEQPAEIAEAQALCRTCPLRIPCLQGAVERQEPWGVWGGHLFDRGRPIAQKRRRGRPRKDEAARQLELEVEIEQLIDEERVEVA